MEQTLYYRSGPSDKVYWAGVIPKDDGFVVEFAFGRRGTTLQTGTKTQTSVSYEEAKKIFDKLIASKQAKGYTVGEEGTPYRHTAKEQEAAGIAPQLLNAISEGEAKRLLHDPDWCMQEKHDGKRMLVRKRGEQVEGINRRGLVVALPQSIAAAAATRTGDFIIDGEAIGDTLLAFDLLELGADDYRPQPYELRLAQLIRLLKGSPDALVLVQTAFDTADKVEAFERLESSGKEGAVLKLRHAPYTAGRPASGGDALKFKFYEAASFIVSSVNAQRSVSVGLWSERKFVPAGNVTIPAKHPVPPVGAIVEVRYLYAFQESGCIYQPVYLGQRDDVEPLACTIDQLKFKPAVENAA